MLKSCFLQHQMTSEQRSRTHSPRNIHLREDCERSEAWAHVHVRSKNLASTLEDDTRIAAGICNNSLRLRSSILQMCRSTIQKFTERSLERHHLQLEGHMSLHEMEDEKTTRERCQARSKSLKKTPWMRKQIFNFKSNPFARGPFVGNVNLARRHLHERLSNVSSQDGGMR